MLYNINPNLWGPHCWKFMHYLTMAYPNNPTQQDKENVSNFFNSIKNVLPCENCRVHFAMNLQKFPLTDKVLESKYNLINWLKDIHNEVNTRNGKKLYTYDDIIQEYNNNNNDNKVEIITIALLILIIIIIIVYMKYF
jgi:hypothetical protein